MSSSFENFKERIVYLDNAATTKPSDVAVAKSEEMMKKFYANPSSLHGAGIAAEREVEAAREIIASAMGVPSDCLYFTSGGTMSDNIAIRGYLASKKGGRIITSSFEHPAVMECFKSLENFFDVVYLSPDSSGKITADILAEKLTSDTCFVSIMHINNETGAINEIEKISELLRRAGIVFHTDAVQSFLKTPFKYSKTDMASVSGHKTHGPKGVGALYIKKGIKARPIIFGGGQEKNIHSGTLNTQSICSWAAAVEEESKNLIKNTEKVTFLSSMARKSLTDLGGIIISPKDASPYIISVVFEGYIAENILHYLSARDIFVATGSACSSKKGSHVMSALGLEKYSKNALRVSFSHYNDEKDVMIFIAGLQKALKEIIHS